jgi:hypothetical protein
MIKASLLNEKILKKGKAGFIPSPENNFRPSFFRSRFLFIALFFIILLRLLIIPFILYLPTSNFFAEVTKTALFNSVNEERKDQGLAILETNFLLDEAAYAKAQDMLEEDYFSHTSPEGLTPWHWFRYRGYDYQYAGENLAIGFLNSCEVVKAWMNSETHRQNILNPNYEDMGLAVLRGEFQGKETTLVVQLFGARTLVEKTGVGETSSSLVEEEETSVEGIAEVNGQEVAGEQEINSEESTVEQPVLEDDSQSVEPQPVEENKIGIEESKPLPENSPLFLETEILPENQTLNLKASFLRFLNQHYEDITRGILLAFFVLVALAIFLLVAIRIDQPAPELIWRGSLIFVILATFLLFEGELFLKFLPHQFLIG